ncbi:MAG: putative Ig domain-containing protein [Vicinamibacterales bacterium]
MQYTKLKSQRALLALAFLVALLAPTAARADSLTLAWDANPESDVIGYYVFIGTASGVYSTIVDVGNATTYTFTSAVPGTTYYLTVAAYVAGPIIGQNAPELVATTGGGPSLSNPGNRSDQRDTPLSLTLLASDPDGDGVTFNTSGLPIGLLLNTATGVISGTPSSAGVFNVAVTASDASGNTASQYFTWTIVAADTEPPAIAITSPTSTSTHATSSAFVTLSGTATDDLGVTSVTWSNNRGGSGSAAGTLNWSVIVPLEAGSNLVTLTAADASGKSTATTLTVGVDLAPTVTISSPTSSPSYTTNASTIALSGSASDDGTVSRVQWSNSRGGSGTASGTTSWTAAGIAVQDGLNVLTITAQDTTGHSSSVTLAVTMVPPPLQLTGLTANKTAPQAAGTAITFTAAATGGSGPYSYKWWLFDGNGWSIVQQWSSANTFTWTPGSASSAYRVGVWVRSAGRTADTSDNDNSNSSVAFPVTQGAQPLAVTSLTSDKASPQLVSTAIRFTAAANGGAAPYEFQWRVFDGSTWTTAQTWNAAATFMWTPTAASANYQVQVWARSAGNTVDAAENAGSAATRSYAINTVATGRLSLTTLTADKAAPQAAQTTITFTAAAAGGAAPHQFKWWIFDGQSWVVEKDWSTQTTLTWTPGRAGNYRIGVWVRSAGSTTNASENDDSNGSIALLILNTGVVSPARSSQRARSAGSKAPPISATLTTDKSSPQAIGTAVTFKALVTGGDRAYKFRWKVFDGVTWAIVTPWSDASTFVWRPSRASDRVRISVWVRPAGNSLQGMSSGDTSSELNFVIKGQASPLAVTNLSSDKASPQLLGTAIRFTATTTGGAGPISYKWRVYNGSSWSVAQNWSASSSFLWAPAASGSAYQVEVWARSTGSTTDAPENSSSSVARTYTITYSPTSPLRLLALTPSASSPIASGSPVTVTTTVTGGVPQLQYKWWLFDGRSWQMLTGWSTSSSYTWTPSAAGSQYRIGVWVRSSTNSFDMSDNDAANGSIQLIVE